MHRPFAVLGSAVFLVFVPGTVTILIPWWISRWRMSVPLLGFSFFRILGILLILAGLPVLLDSFLRFALQGLGTPAPIAPTEHLVVTGFYRLVRNPMYLAVVSLIVGQGFLLGDRHVVIYGLFVFLTVHVFVRLYEEPTLLRTFGSEYEDFCVHVHRWVPRLHPWNGQHKESHNL